ncbi:ImuA family protein [Phenylobacterium sp. J367]|uniref:ImuA family protein n=1 Tax=Phenylobacterium sp. J367 TaxID=2898435 RepID=UPI0021517211|nr:protein imuA [Phenylobacterium sp. J367]MCR5877950.1 protein imuA [Phenylobacterium sp. J367]
MSGSRSGALAALKAKVAALEAGGRPDSESLPFGAPDIDLCLPGGGLPLGRWHELVADGMELETAAAAAAVAALMAAPLARRGEAVWVLRRDDLWAPGLLGLGFPPERLIQVCARDEAEALSVMEDALSTVGVSAVFGEVEAVDLTAGRRLQLACEKMGATGFVIRRRPYGGTAKKEAAGSAATTRWRVASAPSEPAMGELGLGAPRFRLALERCRGGRTGAWFVEASGAYSMEAGDVAHPLRLVADVGDLGVAPAPSERRAA